MYLFHVISIFVCIFSRFIYYDGAELSGDNILHVMYTANGKVHGSDPE